jgi:hypothetical protein
MAVVAALRSASESPGERARCLKGSTLATGCNRQAMAANAGRQNSGPTVPEASVRMDFTASYTVGFLARGSGAEGFEVGAIHGRRIPGPVRCK